ncbi:hypothetical protein NL676_037303 [Syzygium grande]|nr:hypothetical protein NL676_037303 [Syzygium grande]
MHDPVRHVNHSALLRPTRAHAPTVEKGSASPSSRVVSMTQSPSLSANPSRSYEDQIRDISSVFSPVGFGFIHPNARSFL